MMRVLLLLLMIQGAWASPVLVRDLRPTWTVVENGNYRAIGETDTKGITTIYFSVDPVRFGGHHLMVHCAGNWHLFVNGKLVSVREESAHFSMDSLYHAFGRELLVGIRASEGFRDAITKVVFLGAQVSRGPGTLVRPPTFFRDFGIMVSLFLLVFFLLLLRTNPQLTLDYFSFSKIFSASERNETQLASRITSSANLLFYLFSALLTGFLLAAIIYSSGPSFHVARVLRMTSLGSTISVWGILSACIFLLLAAKLTIVLVFSTLFNFRETISFQFFNFLRFVLFTAMVMALMSLFFFTLRVDSAELYERLIALGLLLLTVGSIAVLLKLLRKSRFSFFHLFSYLCISEFIPLVIIFKIFY